MSNITIKCPICGKEVEIEYRPEYDNKSLTCRECHVRSAFTEWTIAENNFPPPPPPPQAYPIGKLIIPSLNNSSFQLKEGSNTVGRKHSAPNQPHADIEIPINVKVNRTSRIHFNVNVTKNSGLDFSHTFSLYKSEVNATSVNGINVEYGNHIELKHGDVIHLPDVDVIFELSDNDCTEFYTQYK